MYYSYKAKRKQLFRKLAESENKQNYSKPIS